MRARWRTAVVGVAMVAAACGNTVVGGDGDPPKLPISSTGGGAAAAGDASTAMMRAEDGIAPSMAPVRPIEYRLADSAEAPATSAEAHQLRKVDDVADRVAKALGVAAADVDAGSGYGDWWYSNDEAANTAVSSVAVPDCAPDAKCEAPEPTPAPKLEGVPLPDDAKTKAKAILDELGVSVDDDGLDIQGDDGYFRTVTYVPSVDGVPVPMMTSSITFGAHSQIQYANGFLFESDGVGSYPLVSLADAFDRHQNGFGWTAVPERLVDRGEAVPASDPGAVDAQEDLDARCAADGPDCGAAGSSGSAEETEPSSGGGSSSSAGSPGIAAGEPPPDGGPPITIEPQPTTPTEPLEPQILEVTRARLVLEPVATGCLDDPVYLVPAFELLLADDGGPIGTVTAVTDDALDTPDPAATESRVCPEDEVRDLPAGKTEPAPVPPDAGAVEPQTVPTPESVVTPPSKP